MSLSPSSRLVRRCLAVGLVVAFPAWFAGCGGSKESGPISSKTSQFEVADDSAGPAPAKVRVGDQPDSKPAGGVKVRVADAPSGLVSDEAIMPQEPTDTAVDQPPQMPPLVPGGKPLDLKAIPGDRDALVAFLEQLRTQRPQGQTEQQFVESFRQLQQARIDAAEKLLAVSKEKKDELTAVNAKLEGMRELVRARIPTAEKQLHSYCRELQKNPDKALAKMGRLELLGQAVNALANGQITDVKPVLADLKALVADGTNDEQVFQTTAQVAVALQMLGMREASLDAMRTVVAAYKDSTVPAIKDQAAMLAEQIRATEMDYEGKLKALSEGKPDSVQPVLEAMTALSKVTPPGEMTLNLLDEGARRIEMAGHYEPAGKAYALLETAFKDHKDAAVVKHVTQRTECGRRRLALLGQTFVVEGVTPDGAKFDWARYQGKIVLVDFWATWCTPCLREIPNIIKHYEQYRAKGFEVVGVNLDNEPETVKKVLDLQPLPWTTVISADENAHGFETPLAVKCGVDAIPFVVLLDREGKVIELHVTGQRLTAALEKLLGPPAEASTPATGPAPVQEAPAKPAP